MRDSEFQEWLDREYSHLDPKPILAITVSSPCGELYRLVQFDEPLEVCLFVEASSEDDQLVIMAVGWSNRGFSAGGVYGDLPGGTPQERMVSFAEQANEPY
jgi:hypothetical protein